MSAAPAPVAAPAAPAKPAAAPATPAAAPAKPGVKTDHLSNIPNERPTADWMGDVGAELDQLSDEGDAIAEGRKPAVRAPKKPAAAEPNKPAVDPEKPAAGKSAEDDESAAGAEVEPPAPAQPTKLNDLRSAYSKLKQKEDAEYKPTIQKLEARVKELEGATPPEVSVLQERLTAVEKRNEELEQTISFVDYSKSKEYQEKYERPYQEAWNDALADLSELVVENADGSTRQATQDDLVALANMPLGAARKQANALFGDSADDVMLHRRKILDLAAAQRKALEDAKSKGVERTKLNEAKTKANREQSQKAWNDANGAVVTKWPKMFGKIEDDPEGNALLEKGFALADRLFSPTAETAPKSEQEAIAIHALMRNKIANHDRLALWNKKQRARIKELEDQLKAYEQSDPNGGLSGGGDGAGGKAGNYLDDANAELDRLDKQA